MHKQFISIWFFIGLLLTVYGVLICGTGIYELFHPPQHAVQLAQYHASIWWGALLLVLGLFYSIKFRPKNEQ
jgi:cytochrome c biogenesis protein CcdA